MFINKRDNYVKSAYWDRTGFCLFAKRLERGRFVFPGNAETFELSEQKLCLLLEGNYQSVFRQR